MAFPVLLVEDKDSLRGMLRHALEAQGHLVLEARDEPEALQHLQQSRPAVVLTDLKLPRGDGFGVLRAAKELDPELQVVVMTAFGSIQDAVTAMKQGAMDFLAKPVDPDHSNLMVERAIAQRRMLSEYVLLKEELAQRRGAPRIIGEDPQLRQVSQQLHRAAQTDATVLLEGESGTGKELFARALHALSPRADGPFVAINCAAIPDTLLETELFGHEKGAFTGAVGAQAGPVRDGAPGHAVPRRDWRPAARAAGQDPARARRPSSSSGSAAPVHCMSTSRVVAATNRQLKARVAARQFREDLYFRLSVFPITIPPLRERGPDIPMLARHFVEKFCRDLNKQALLLSPAALDELRAYPWPGNVRELQNCIERAVILCEGRTIHARHLNLSFAIRPIHSRPRRRLPPPLRRAAANGNPLAQVDLSGTLTEAVKRVTAIVERVKLEEALRNARGNKERAAEALQVSYKALLQKQREHGLAD